MAREDYYDLDIPLKPADLLPAAAMPPLYREQ
jgi:hypothetical protein